MSNTKRRSLSYRGNHRQPSASSAHHGVIQGILVLETLDRLFDLHARLERAREVSLDLGVVGMHRFRGSLTLGSRLSAVVKCRTAAFLSRKILASLPSRKCTCARSGARSLRIMSSHRAPSKSRIAISALAFLSRTSGARGANSAAREKSYSAWGTSFCRCSTEPMQQINTAWVGWVLAAAL